jgi:nucleotide-binding universal stress UspA family protein
MGRPKNGRRVLVATDQPHCPIAALEHAAAVAGQGGEVVLASVVVVPVTQPLDAQLDRPISRACEVLEDAEEVARSRGGAFDTRLVRARSFAKGVMQTLSGEPFDMVVLERGKDPQRNDGAGQTEAIVEKADTTVVVVRPA